MASNNSRPNRFVPEGGGGWRKIPQQQPRRSAKPSLKHGNNKGEVLRYLKELFGQVLDEEIIESVAESCGWHADSAIESLIELSNDSGVSTNNHSPNFLVSHSNQAKVVDQPRKALPYKAPRATQTGTLSQAMAAIKVAYQGYDDDSDDADIIMEEEEEFEVGLLGNQSLPSLSDGDSSSLQGLGTSVAQNSLRDVKRGPKECPELSTIRDYICSGNKILILMRGCPGSGKSHLARTLVAMFVDSNCDPAHYIFSTDAYFTRSGQYVFNPGDLPNAHEWNQKCVTTSMQKGFSPIIVDNTNTMIWEMKAYAKLAVQFGYAVELLEPTTPWRWKESELARRNSHGVLRPAIRNMLDRYEKVTADQLMTRLKLLYGPGNNPPQPCSNPVNKKTKNYPIKETEQNIIMPTVQLQTQAPPSLLALKLEKLDVTPLNRNDKVTSSLTQEQLATPLVTEKDQTYSMRSQNLFTDLKPLTQAPLFTKVKTVQQHTIKKEIATPVVAPDVTVGKPMPEVESLESLVDAQGSIGWQLIESLNDVITISQLDSESASTHKETTEPDFYKNMCHDVDYAPKSSNELFEEMEETNASFILDEGLKIDEGMESLEKVLGDAFDLAFKLPFANNEVAQEEAMDTPSMKINGQTRNKADNSSTSPVKQMCRDDQRNPDASINTCLEYVLVGSDNSLLCQKSHDDFDKGTEDVIKQVIEQVLSESVDNLHGDDPNEDKAQSDSLQLPEEIVTSIEDNCRDTANPFMGLLEKTEKSTNKEADVCFEEKIAIKDNQPFRADLLKELASQNTSDKLDNAVNVFQTHWAVPETKSSEFDYLSSQGKSERCKSEPNEASQPADTKRVVSSPPEKVSTKLDLFSWFFTKKKPLPDLTESQQISKDTGLLGFTSTGNNSTNLATESTHLPNQSKVEAALPLPDSIKWKLNSSWNHLSVEEDGTSQEYLPTVRTAIEISNSSTTCADASCDTSVQIINKSLKNMEDDSSEKQLSEVNLKDQTVPGSMLSEHATSSSNGELEKHEFCIVSSSDNVLDSMSTFNSDVSLLDAEIPNAVQKPPIGSENGLASSSNDNTVQERPIDSEPGLTSSSNANTTQETPMHSEPSLTSLSNANTTQETPIDSEPGLESSSSANTTQETSIDSEPGLASSSSANTSEEAQIDSEPDLTISSNANTTQETPIDCEPDLASSSNANTTQETPIDCEPGLASSSYANLQPVPLMDKTIGLDDLNPTSDLTESESGTVDITSHLEENISSRLGSQSYQYTSAWSKMSPSNLLQDDEIPSTPHLVPNVSSKIPTKDSETNTSYSDFSLIEQECTDDFQYISGHSRSINVGRNSEIHRTVPTISTLDKGSMTAPEDFDSEQPDFELLVNMFPKIARELLKELFEKCQGEINWTVDLLLESGHAFEPSESLEIRFHNTEDLQVTQQLLEELDIRDMKRSIELDVGSSVTRGFETCEAEEPDTVFQPDEGSGTSTSKAPSTSPSKKGNKKQTSELSLRLKKEMEKNIDLNDSSYSEETLRLKKIRRGQPLNSVKTEHSSEISGASGHDAVSGSVASSSDVSKQQDANDQEYDADVVDDEEGSVPFKLDAEFLAQLQSLFGELNYPYPDGVAPVVDLPVTLARQIHSVLMESQQKQFDMQEKYFANMIKDEEFARRLQEEEMPAPDFRQIMDMELALELYKADVARLSNETKDDMATRLSKRKLTELFPTVDPEMLFDVFAAHGNSFQETLEVLEASTGEPEEAVRNVMSPEALLQYEKQLIENAKQESFKQREVEQDQANSAFERSASTASSSKDQALQQAKLYREEANRQYQLRNRCYQQAHDAMRNGQTAVASYYAQVGQLYKQYIDKANARAAASLLTAHTMCKNSTTLDLHYLFVVEALQALDIFVDHHISKLVDSGKSSQQLFLITGGGNRSVGGRPKIKPAVQKRLIHRGIKYSELNHGQLRIVITRHMALSNGNTV